MRMKKIVLTMLLAALVLLGGCSRPASDHPDSNEDPSPVTENTEEESSESSDNQSDESDETPSEDSSDEESETEETDESKTEEDDEKTEDEKDDEEKPFDPDDLEANSSQGCYKIFDSGFEITVKEPFVVYYDPLSDNMTVTIPDDPSCRGFIFYDTSEQCMTQLETTVKSLEASSKEDPTITDMTKDVDEQDDGLFSMTFSYSAGATEGSPAGFYFVHYQTTPNGVINVNLSTSRSSNSEQIRELIDSIQPVTENAVEYGK